MRDDGVGRLRPGRKQGAGPQLRGREREGCRTGGGRGGAEGFADRSDPDAVVIAPGYLDGRWTTQSWTGQGLRDEVGAGHLPLPRLLQALVNAGLVLEEFAEHGAPTPVVLGVRVRTPL